MNSSEPTGYENEPNEHFQPLPGDVYCSLFDHLRQGAAAENSWYREILGKHSCRSVLELGCGTGQICEYLQHSGFTLFGIDTDREMLNFARQSRRVPSAEMDMTRLGFSPVFDAAVAPCNTFNLLQDEGIISRCLTEISQVLRPSGLLIMQLFVPDQHLIERAGEKLFQFIISDLPDGGKLIRETIRTYHPQARLLVLEERYKLRNSAHLGERVNYAQSFRLAAFEPDRWLSILENGGFSILSTHGQFDQSAFVANSHSTLLLVAGSNRSA